MAHILTSNGKESDLTYDDAYRSFLITRTEPGVKGFLKNMIEAIAKSKMRRIERELEFRGIQYGRPNNDWVSNNFGQGNFRER